MNRKTSIAFSIAIVICFLVGLIFFKTSGNAQSKESKKEVNKTSKTTTTKVQGNNKNQKSEATLTLMGDLFFEQPFYDATKDIEKSDYFELVNEYFKRDDLTIGNMEVVIGNNKMEASGSGTSFCAPESVGKLISKQSIEVLATANDHAYDKGAEGVNSTIDFFNNNSKILTVGTNKQKSDIEKVQYVEVKGIKIGFLAYTLGTNIKMEEKDQYRVNSYRNLNTNEVDDTSKKRIKEDVERTKKETDVVIVMMHWGDEFTNQPNKEQEEMATYLNSLGVDLIIGNQAHAIQPIKYIGKDKKTLVYYGLGNFTSADDNIIRAGEEFDNAYQFGLLSTLKITKDNGKITIGNVKTEPVINYYDKDMKNFKLVPYTKYNSDLEKSHKRFNNNFSKKFIENMYKRVLDAQFRK